MKTRKVFSWFIIFTVFLGLVVTGHAVGSITWQQYTLGEWRQDAFENTQPHPAEIWIASSMGDYPALAHVTDQVAFDADADGDIDLAVTGWEENRLLLNDGSGRLSLTEAGDFDERAAWSVGLTAFDADGDGDMDLAVVEEHGPLPNRLYLNDGHGVFSRIDAGDFDDEVQTTYQVIAFDADNDGDIDLAVGRRGAVQLYLNDGAANFTKVESGDFDDCPCPETFALAVFDADGDGDLDVVFLDCRMGVV